ncbi:MAG TPA: hypothetical protein VGD26_01570, partial [Chitinophagaceae bacterium]
MSDNSIKKGDKFLCTSDVVHKDNIFYKSGNVYKSDLDDCITDEYGTSKHNWAYNVYNDVNWPDVFKRLEEPIQFVDRDYFQSMQDEHYPPEGTFKAPENNYIIELGDRFYCYNSLGETYTKGKYYVSEHEGCITDNFGETLHGWSGRWKDHFRKIETTAESTSSYQGTELLISQECDALKELLIEKNRAYGDSALKNGVLFDISPVEAIKARINDKA